MFYILHDFKVLCACFAVQACVAEVPLLMRYSKEKMEKSCRLWPYVPLWPNGKQPFLLSHKEGFCNPSLTEVVPAKFILTTKAEKGEASWESSKSVVLLGASRHGCISSLEWAPQPVYSSHCTMASTLSWKTWVLSWFEQQEMWWMFLPAIPQQRQWSPTIPGCPTCDSWQLVPQKWDFVTQMCIGFVYFFIVAWNAPQSPRAKEEWSIIPLEWYCCLATPYPQLLYMAHLMFDIILWPLIPIQSVLLGKVLIIKDDVATAWSSAIFAYESHMLSCCEGVRLSQSLREPTWP